MLSTLQGLDLLCPVTLVFQSQPMFCDCLGISISFHLILSDFLPPRFLLLCLCLQGAYSMLSWYSFVASSLQFFMAHFFSSASHFKCYCLSVLWDSISSLGGGPTTWDRLVL